MIVAATTSTDIISSALFLIKVTANQCDLTKKSKHNKRGSRTLNRCLNKIVVVKGNKESAFKIIPKVELAI